MINTEDMSLEERKDLLYDIRDGKVKYEDVIWGYRKEKNSIHTIGEVTPTTDNLQIESMRQSMVDYLNTYMLEDNSNVTKDQRTWWNNCITFITTAIITGNADNFINKLWRLNK